jgi:hypothetical protein
MEHQRSVQGRYATKTIGRDRGMHSARNGGPGDGELLCICTTHTSCPCAAPSALPFGTPGEYILVESRRGQICRWRWLVACDSSPGWRCQAREVPFRYGPSSSCALAAMHVHVLST